MSRQRRHDGRLITGGKVPVHENEIEIEKELGVTTVNAVESENVCKSTCTSQAQNTYCHGQTTEWSTHSAKLSLLNRRVRESVTQNRAARHSAGTVEQVARWLAAGLHPYYI